MGIDVGTSGCKTVVTTPGGRVIASATATYPTNTGPDGHVTQDARSWLAAVRRTIRECCATVDPHRIAALAVTGPAHAAVLIDARGEPLAPVLLAFDGRPSGIAAELRAAAGQSLFDTTFVELGPAWTLPQLVWMRRHRPDLWPHIRSVLVVKDFIVHRLTGSLTTDPSDAAGTAMFDQRRREWDSSLVGLSGLTLDQLPSISDSSARAGGVSTAWAHSTGLRTGTPVFVGATDTAVELVSVGALGAGDGLVKIGSTGTVVAVTRQPRPDRRLMTYPHAVANRWYTLAATNTAAAAYRWFVEKVLKATSPQAIAEIERDASQVSAGSEGLVFLPFLEGERSPYWDPMLRGAFVGISAGHGRAHFTRALMEGVAFALRNCCDVMDEVGLNLRRPYLTGGGLSSGLWRDIVVAAMGREGRLANPHGPAFGSALLALSAMGLRPPLDKAPPRPRRERQVIPRPAWVNTYKASMRVFLIAVSSTTKLSHEIAGGFQEADGR